LEPVSLRGWWKRSCHGFSLPGFHSLLLVEARSTPFGASRYNLISATAVARPLVNASACVRKRQDLPNGRRISRSNLRVVHR
jgi:hypothetical protein